MPTQILQHESVQVVEEEIGIDENEFACANLKQEIFDTDGEIDHSEETDIPEVLEEEIIHEDEYGEHEMDPEGMFLLLTLA